MWRARIAGSECTNGASTLDQEAPDARGRVPLSRRPHWHIHGQGSVAAPGCGTRDAAQARPFSIVMAGVPADVERCRSLIGNLGQQTFIVGADRAHAKLIKLLGNMMMATTLEMLGETVALFRKRGLDPKLFVEILTSTMFGGRAHRLYGDKIVAQRYAPGLALPLALKDVRLALAEA